MKNVESIKHLCTAIANTFYPANSAIIATCNVVGVDPDGETEVKDPNIFRCAYLLVRGYVEGSRSENGISTSVKSEDAINQSLLVWCRTYGLDPQEELGEGLRVVYDGSKLW